MDLILPGAAVLLGDCVARLKGLDDKSVQMCVTSPPYYGLRDYGVDGQLGLEATPEEFIAGMVAVFREVRRVLTDDGTLWVNIGDSYARTGGSDRKPSATATVGNTIRSMESMPSRKQRVPDGLKEKDLIGIPWMLAFALRADGWYLRQEIIWHKPNPMPESVTDRCTKAHETLFLLAKSPRYFFDAVAVKEPAVGVQSSTGVGWNKTSAADPRDTRGMERGRSRRDSFKREGRKREQTIPGQDYGTHRQDRDESAYDITTRNRRSVWTIATKPYKGAHFAVFPPALVEPCILAGTSKGGHCPECGARWERVQGEAEETGGRRSGNIERKQRPDSPASHSGNQAGSIPYVPTMRATLGWSASCACNVAAVPDIVLDPFNGSGTTGQVALQHGRHYVGCELNPEYIQITEQRLSGVLDELSAAIAAKAEADAQPVQLSLID